MREAPRATYQTPSQEIYSEGVGVREESCKGFPFTERQSANVITRPPGGNSVEFIKGGCTEHIKNEGELMVVVPTWEKRFP